MVLLAVSEAAERLGVSTRQVQHLATRGELRRLARGVFDETSVERLGVVRGGSHKRAWSEATAWGAVALLTGVKPVWMGENQRSRLKARLRALAAEGLVERARDRAKAARYAGHSSTVSRLRNELVDTSRVAAGLGLADANTVDGYLATSDVDPIVARHGLIRDDEGRFTLRVTKMDLAVVAALADRGAVLAALDLAESLVLRERRAGLQALESALESFRG